jgi:glycosyltransferase involved in cell wall biosynthesis
MIRPSVPVWRLDGALVLDRKFKDGMDAWCEAWPGRVVAMMDVVDIATFPPFGADPFVAGQSRFELRPLAPDQSVTAADLRSVDLLLASADDHRQLASADLSAEAGIPCIMAIEYTLKTRFGFLRYSQASLFKKMKTAVWLLLNERRVKSTLGRAQGMQANGNPALRAYANSMNSPMRYFDTRLARADVVTPAALDERLAALEGSAAIRLAFSGRLIEAKGADALVPLAIELKRLGVDFRMDIFGSGDLERAIEQAIVANDLAGQVRLRGAVDFQAELMPTLREKADLFICCHRQGDPSCTYAETLGCGVPIAGFSNEALQTMIDEIDVGWAVPMNDVRALAALVANLSRNRHKIVAKSIAARKFGEQFNFESSFASRAAHCLAVLEHHTTPTPT